MSDRGEVCHELKTWPEFFRKVWDGKKPFELRKDDRDFRVGDRVILSEYDPSATESYSGRWIAARISDIIRDVPEFGLMPGFAILALEIVERVPTGHVRDGVQSRCGVGL
jgi:hypothetical protein